jgi:hypothetical protein
MCITTTTQKDNNKTNTAKEHQGKKFVGGNSSLRGKIFDVSSRDAIHQFTDTVKAIADHVGQAYIHGGDIRFMIENLEDYQFV